MILALDVHYRDNGSKAVGLTFESWEAAVPERIYTDWRDEVAEYEPGAFYKRELPCLRSLLEKCGEKLWEAIVVDGYVELGAGRKGLGAHLFEAISGTAPVIGLAKTYFQGAESFALPLLRGTSANPLWITAAGIDPEVARSLIASMAGAHRLPALLRELDRLTKADD